MEVEYDEEVECTCPKCGHVFKTRAIGTVDIEPPEREEPDF